jgi:hypothetical protein
MIWFAQSRDSARAPVIDLIDTTEQQSNLTSPAQLRTAVFRIHNIVYVPLGCRLKVAFVCVCVLGYIGAFAHWCTGAGEQIRSCLSRLSIPVTILAAVLHSET